MEFVGAGGAYSGYYCGYVGGGDYGSLGGGVVVGGGDGGGGVLVGGGGGV